MGRLVELPSIKLRSTSRHQGLRKLSPDLISKARDETATQVTRIGLTFLGTAAFCLLSLLSPDSALLGSNEKINVPFAGPVSFFGFMLLGPAVLVVLRVYLQIYVEHSDRLDRLARSVSPVRAPTLLPLQNSLLRVFSGFIFYLLLPVTMMLFAWKAAVFPAWGSALLCVATGVVVSHVMLPFSRFSWRSKALLSISAAIISAAIIAGGVVLGFGPPRRPFELSRANLSGQWLPENDLRNADLHNADLSKANLSLANLGGAYLSGANLSGANLRRANLSGAIGIGANLSDTALDSADVRGAKLGYANLRGANLGYAKLSGANLDGAKLVGAELITAKLADAQLVGADLSDARLFQVDLVAANLREANLAGASLLDANLSGANLSYADLQRANLRGANLSGANLSYADLPRANLRGANLSGAEELTQTQLDKACGDADTRLPEGLTLKSCPKD